MKTIRCVIMIIIICLLNVNVVKSQPKIENQKKLVITQNEKMMLQKMAVAEAEGEGIEGMAYVIQTIINRVESNDFENTIENVIKEKHQFESYTNGRYENAEINDESKIALKMVLEEEIYNKGQLYFENINCKNTYASLNRCECFIYNNHRFYY